mmetsp:Transcript_35840/g.83529  ORF Transcript_35840/g.83529 Transcript_35840/m.83529 type:complete len:221 (-) Transcript_35840:500-1162(-)
MSRSRDAAIALADKRHLVTRRPRWEEDVACLEKEGGGDEGRGEGKEDAAEGGVSVSKVAVDFFFSSLHQKIGGAKSSLYSTARLSVSLGNSLEKCEPQRCERLAMKYERKRNRRAQMTSDCTHLVPTLSLLASRPFITCAPDSDSTCTWLSLPCASDSDSTCASICACIFDSYTRIRICDIHSRASVTEARRSRTSHDDRDASITEPVGDKTPAERGNVT